jgi:ankyrin repeat protein
LNTADKDGDTPLYIASQNGHLEVQRDLLKHGADVKTADKDGDTPLYIAIQNGYFEVLRNLLKIGAGVNTGNKNRVLLVRSKSE